MPRLEKARGRTHAPAQAANRELESFAYAVSHDLRAAYAASPAMSQILQETASDSRMTSLCTICDAFTTRVGACRGLVEALLGLSRISTADLAVRPCQSCSLKSLRRRRRSAAREIPDHNVTLDIAPNLHVEGDARLLRIAMDYPLANAWKCAISSAAHRDGRRANRITRRAHLLRAR